MYIWVVLAFEFGFEAFSLIIEEVGIVIVDWGKSPIIISQVTVVGSLKHTISAVCSFISFVPLMKIWSPIEYLVLSVSTSPAIMWCVCMG